MELKELQKMYRITFDSGEGKEVLADLKSAYYHRSSFNTCPYETAYKEGQRAVIIRIINLIKEQKND